MNVIELLFDKLCMKSNVIKNKKTYYLIKRFEN